MASLDNSYKIIYDATTQEMLEILCHAFSALLSRLVQDHLPGRACYNSTVRISNETKSVSKTKSVSEREFGVFRGKSQMPTPVIGSNGPISSNKTING